MKGWALLGLVLIAYAAFVVYLNIKKPEKIWDMAKIRMFRKLLGEKGTVIFFYIFAAVALGFGIWLLTLWTLTLAASRQALQTQEEVDR